MQELKQKWALFWNRLFYPMIFDELDGEKLTHYIETLSTTEIIFPNGERKKPSKATLWRKLAAYRQGGLHALERKPRSDQGKSRTVALEVIDKAVEIKRELPTRSAVTINRFLEKYYGKKLPKTTLYRHLRQAGATKIKLGLSTSKVRCRWTREHSNSLWVGDFQDGPMVLIDGRACRTYLSAFIDCHSRYVVDARYYLRENTAILIDTLLRAWQIHGKSRALYADNAKVYYSDALESACCALSIRLLHRPPREPETGGIIEKFFQTTQSRFESEVRALKIMNLDSLNRAFSAWLEVDYHQTVHSQTGQSPQERYQKDLPVVEQVDLNAAIRFFMLKVERKVHRDFSDVSVNGRFYNVDPRLRGDKVIVRYDPFGDLRQVLIYSLKEQYLGIANHYHREKQQQVQPIKQSGQVRHDYLALLIEEHERKLNLQSQGIDFTTAVKVRQWPFLGFVATLSQLMGRKGGASAFNASEYEALTNIYNRTANLTELMLIDAFEKAEVKDIINIAYQLQQLK